MDYPLLFRLIKDFFISLFVGASVFSTTFIISLLIGTASNHPVLGPVDVMYAVAVNIVILGLLIALTKELLVRADASIATSRLVTRRQLIGKSLQEQLKSGSQPLKRPIPVQ